MKIRLRRPRELAVALRDLAQRRPREAEVYLDEHPEEWGSLATADPHDAADILEAIDGEAAAELIASLPRADAAEVLEEMDNEAAAEMLEDIDPMAAAAIVARMPVDEAADIVGQLDPELRIPVLEAIDADVVDQITGLLAFPPDSAGGLMKTQPATLQIGITSGEAIEALRRLHEQVDDLTYVYVVDLGMRLQGVVSFRDLVFARPGTALDEVMVANPVAVRPDTDRERVSELIQRYNLLAMPVVDHRGVLLGIVTVEDAIDAVQREASEDIAAMVGAGVEETLYTSVAIKVRNRLPWIAVNLAIAFMVAGVISRFEPVIERLAVLAAYMPVVASVGGNGGAQSQAVIIRALATEDVPSQLVRRVLLREVAAGAINGAAIGLLSGLIAAVLTTNGGIGLVIGIAAFANMVLANLAGTGIPLILNRLGQDPALASNIFLTMVTDLVGFGGFLGIATVLL